MQASSKNKSEFKIDKHLVKDSGQAKTLETLNRSVDKNSHVRSFTMTTVALGAQADFSGDSTAKYTNHFSSNTQVSPFKPALHTKS